MPLAADITTIRTRFVNQFVAARPTVPYRLPNDQPYEPLPTTTWARLTVLPATGDHAGIGGNTRLFRYLGLIDVQIFVPLGEGDGTAHEIADDVETIFRGITDGNVRTRGPGRQVIGETKEGFFCVSVLTKFWADYVA